MAQDAHLLGPVQSRRFGHSLGVDQQQASVKRGTQVFPPAVRTAPLRLVLGSASPRRQRLLREMGLTFEVLTADAAEILNTADPVGTVIHNARAKHTACRAICPDTVLITADTLVWFEGRLIGKPAYRAEAVQFLRDFSDRSQTVFTAVACSMPGAAGPDMRIEASHVRFRKLNEELIQTYLTKTAPFDRAGAYDICENGDLLIADYAGSYTNIVGLPLESVCDWLRQHVPELLNG